ncbi:post-GPI attachment to proteins factor 2-like [Anopheles albimanus]|uniref:CWH43-like N-terminal domain-containing protein n=1 Tax=Anopheles albimanus TaxID=7167 RepID=A0A182FJN5_ANOAL|nr:post-GPI attachment to proteins factor 2-like [Anopheles albimanus]
MEAREATESEHGGAVATASNPAGPSNSSSSNRTEQRATSVSDTPLQHSLPQQYQQHQLQQQQQHQPHDPASGVTYRKSRTNARSKDRAAPAVRGDDEDGGNRTHCKTLPEQLVVHLIIGFRDMCVFTLVLPLGTLFVCFVSAYVFQPEEIHETHCRVYNIIPSISAITGVSPQRYLWRISIALHIGPRFIIAFVYRNWYRAMLADIADPGRAARVRRMINTVYWLNLLEISALCGVTYISNKENYPLHEKVFIVFMVTSLSYMLATLKLLKLLQPNGPQTPYEESSLLYKQAFFALSIASTIGLIVFFLKHRFFCQDLAFSWFALCEYIVASANMGFHCTTMLDFPTEDLLIARHAKQYKKPHASLGWKVD